MTISLQEALDLLRETPAVINSAGQAAIPDTDYRANRIVLILLFPGSGGYTPFHARDNKTVELTDSGVMTMCARQGPVSFQLLVPRTCVPSASPVT